MRFRRGPAHLGGMTSPHYAQRPLDRGRTAGPMFADYRVRHPPAFPDSVVDASGKRTVAAEAVIDEEAR